MGVGSRWEACQTYRCQGRASQVLMGQVWGGDWASFCRWSWSRANVGTFDLESMFLLSWCGGGSWFWELLLLWKKILREEIHMKTVAAEEGLWLRMAADLTAYRASAVKHQSLAGTSVQVHAWDLASLTKHFGWLTTQKCLKLFIFESKTLSIPPPDSPQTYRMKEPEDFGNKPAFGGLAVWCI